MAEGTKLSNASDPTKQYTAHGQKHYQGKWARVNKEPALTYTVMAEGAEKIVGYTTINEMIKMACSPDLPEIRM